MLWNIKMISSIPLFVIPIWTVYNVTNLTRSRYSLNERGKCLISFGPPGFSSVTVASGLINTRPQPASDTLHTFALEEDENLEMLECSIGFMVHFLRFTTNKRSSYPFGVILNPNLYVSERSGLFLWGWSWALWPSNGWGHVTWRQFHQIFVELHRPLKFGWKRYSSYYSRIIEWPIHIETFYWSFPTSSKHHRCIKMIIGRQLTRGRAQ